MATHILRKTHPMVLTAAVAVTVFSILGSAAITGLIPSAHSEHQEFQAAAEPDQQPETAASAQDTFKSRVDGKQEVLEKGSAAAKGSSRPASRDKATPASGSGKTTSACSTCGVIESIRMVQREGDGSGLGAVAGGVAGGVVGNQIGSGRGNTLMTILGIGGGAYAGHTIEKKMKTTTDYVVKVRMEDGTYRTVTQASQPEYAVGDHVRVANGRLSFA